MFSWEPRCGEVVNRFQKLVPQQGVWWWEEPGCHGSLNGSTGVCSPRETQPS